VKCHWCLQPGTYRNCQHGEPPRDCPIHGRWTDLSLVARGRHAIIKCVHYGNAWVALWACPIADDKEYGTYKVQFAMVGVGQELYTIPPLQGTCPHDAFDRLVDSMLAGARPSANRIPDPTTRVARPGESLDVDA
jgi:hypothetical protein